MREEAEMMPVTEAFRRNQQSIFLKVYFPHLLEQKVKSHVFSSVNLTCWLAAAASQDLAGLQEVKEEMLNEKSQISHFDGKKKLTSNFFKIFITETMEQCPPDFLRKNCIPACFSHVS